MQFGMCTSLANAEAVRAAGWDYIEESVQSLLRGQQRDEEWASDPAPASAALPVPVCNMLVPGTLKITGPAVDAEALRVYMTRVTARAKRLGIETLVFGSGGARQVPAGWDFAHAKRQMIEFALMSARLAEKCGVTIVMEPLNRGECNIVNSLPEAMEIVDAVNHPNFQCLLDTYHFWLENEPIESLSRCVKSIRHVHLADKLGRVAPGLSGQADYLPVFRVLKSAGYDRRISFEGTAMADFAVTAPRVLEYVRRQWNQA